MDGKVQFVGVKGHAARSAVDAAAKTLGCEFFILDADLVFGAEHLTAAARIAQRDFESGENVAKSLCIEIVRVSSARRQISEATRLMETKPGQKGGVLLAVGRCDVGKALQVLRLEQDDSAISEMGKDVCAFGIAPLEAATVPACRVYELVLEKVAIASIEK